MTTDTFNRRTIPEKNYDYDAFLSYASEDTPWCEKLVGRLRDEDVRVWFDKWELKSGDHLLVRLNDGIRRSAKMIAVWTPNYFRDTKLWTVAEGFSKQYSDVLAQERLLIPLLRAECNIPPLQRNLVSIDFRSDDHFDLSLRKLVHDLNLPQCIASQDLDAKECLDGTARLSHRPVAKDDLSIASYILSFVAQHLRKRVLPLPRRQFHQLCLALFLGVGVISPCSHGDAEVEIFRQHLRDTRTFSEIGIWKNAAESCFEASKYSDNSLKKQELLNIARLYYNHHMYKESVEQCNTLFNTAN